MIRNPVLIAEQTCVKNGSVADLVVLARSGDPLAFAEIYRLHIKQVYAFVSRRLTDREAAEDATQEIFTRALEGLHRCRRAEAFSGFLFGIARHVVDGQFPKPRGASTHLEGVAELVDASPNPEDRAISADTAGELRRARERCLSSSERTLFDLLLAELTDDQIAVATGRRMGAIRTARWRLLIKLRGCLNMLARMTGGHHAPA